MRHDIKDTHQISHIKFNIQYRIKDTAAILSYTHHNHIMTNIIKRIISKRSKVRTFEYTGDTVSIPNIVTHVQFHPSVTEVHDEAFKDCNKLKEVVLSDGITQIGNRSFQGCTKLKRVVLNDGLIQIGDDSFSGCTSLVSITIPSTVTKIGDRAFKDCSTLKQVIYMRCESSTPMFGWDAFRGCPLAVMKFRFDKIEVISHLKELENKINDIDSTIEMRDGYITFPLPLKNRRQIMNRVGNLEQYYEVKEATTLVELAMWKAKISQAEEEVHPVSRDACRIEVPEPAKDLLLQYAYTIPLQW